MINALTWLTWLLIRLDAELLMPSFVCMPNVPQYSPTTKYEGYLFSHDQLHWQSHSNTSEQSVTGQRYIRHRRRLQLAKRVSEKPSPRFARPSRTREDEVLCRWRSSLASLFQPFQNFVVYCTVGGRSYMYARKLVAAGIDAANYRDGILAWFRVGLPLESPDKQPTNAVHPYWRIFQVPDRYEVKTRLEVGSEKGEV